MAERLAMSEKVARDPKIKVTGFEQALNMRYTADTLARVKALNSHVHFIWIMGADSLSTFHKWQKWQEIARTFPIAVIDRPGATLAHLSAKTAKTFHYARVDENDARVLWKKKAPAWTFIHGPRSTLSSTALREGK
jgi:nicotinate-nucleotide adenylyltransferase